MRQKLTDIGVWTGLQSLWVVVATIVFAMALDLGTASAQTRAPQIVRTASNYWERMLVHDLEIDQTRPILLLIINNIGHGGISVRPAPIETVPLQLVRSAILFPGSMQHPES